MTRFFSYGLTAFWLLVLVSFTHAQNAARPTPSQIQVQLDKLPTDTAKIAYLNAIAQRFPNELDAKAEKETVTFMAAQASELAKHTASVRHQYFALHLLFQNMITYQRYKKAQDYAQQILVLVNQTPEPALQAEMYNAVAVSYFYLNDWKNYFDYQFKALRLYEAEGMTASVASVYASLGKAAYYTGDPKEGIAHIRKALAYYRTAAANDKISDLCNDMGTLFMSQENRNDSAEYYLLQAITYAQKGQNENLLTTPQFNLAGIYVAQKKYDQALALVQSALRTAQKGENVGSFILYSVGLSYIYTEMKKNAQAEAVLLEALKDTRLVDNPYQKMQLYKGLSDLYKQTGNAAANVQALEQYIALKDSVFSREKAEAISQTKVEYETEKKEQQIEMLQDRVRARNWIIGISSLAGVLALGLFWGYRRAFRLQKQLRQQAQQTFEQQEKNMRLEQAALQAQTQLAEQKTQALQAEMEAKQRELTTATMFIQQKNELLDSLRQQIRELPSTDESNQKQLHKISQTIRRNMNFDDDWEKIKVHFEGVHPNFFERLSVSSLTDHELRHCAYIKMKFSPKEIASLLHIDVNSVRVSRYRIKKKLGLDTEQDLPDYINLI
ncbi:hypothetical protein SAMN05421780_109105 [Flexibacter flexilis DSM 6793]|uniref:Uncharacterized protein n=1 Tax=Flexibacter flexilis DSM 6793 TaxID=927664 RepID=A0A1I1LRS2_9BACT|nr:hypothetical protein [Flexibacter flexilis]SFC75801.1 hypothetical protein SAMN05421780_109105 [Flexibacter flexilis DSM 6793]